MDLFLGDWRDVETWPSLSEGFSQIIEIVESSSDLKGA
jgi:hypothetical protein